MYIGKSIDARTFSSLISVMNEPAAFLGPAGRIRSVNEPLATRLGLSDAQLIGRRLADLATEDLSAPLKTFLAQNTGRGLSSDATFECALASPNGDVHLSLSPVEEQGGVIGFLCQATTQTAHANLKLRYLWDHLDQGVWEYDIKADRFDVSAAWRKIRGLPPDVDVNIPDHDWLEDIHPEDRAALRDLFEQQVRGDNTSFNLQYRWRGADNRWLWIMCYAKVLDVDEHGKPSYMIGTDTDITAVRENEEHMLKLAEQLRLAVDASAIGIWEFDPNIGKVHWDDKMLEMYGIADGRNDRSSFAWESQLHPDDLEETVAYADHCEAHGLDFGRDYRIIRPSGEVRWIRSRATRVEGYGPFPKLIGANIDITEDMKRTEELEQAKAQLRHDSRHDALTGLANRRLLDESIQANRENTDRYAVLHLDLDFFKAVNDTYGHAVGDAVLVEVAQRLTSVVGEEGLCCRVGGDEFSVFYKKSQSPDHLREVCANIVAAIRAPIHHQHYVCEIGVSIGCAMGRGPIGNPVEVLKRADSALYKAKTAGRNCFRFDVEHA